MPAIQREALYFPSIACPLPRRALFISTGIFRFLPTVTTYMYVHVYTLRIFMNKSADKDGDMSTKY